MLLAVSSLLIYCSYFTCMCSYFLQNRCCTSEAVLSPRTSMKLSAHSTNQGLILFSCVNLYNHPFLSKAAICSRLWAPWSQWYTALCLVTSKPVKGVDICSPVGGSQLCPLCIDCSKTSSQLAWHSSNWLWNYADQGQFAQECPTQAWRILAVTVFWIMGACLDFP